MNLWVLMRIYRIHKSTFSQKVIIKFFLHRQSEKSSMYFWSKFSNKNNMVSAWRNFKNIFPRPLFIIIFRPDMLKFHPYSILTGDTRVEFVIYCVLNALAWRKRDECGKRNSSKRNSPIHKRRRFKQEGGGTPKDNLLHTKVFKPHIKKYNIGRVKKIVHF